MVVEQFDVYLTPLDPTFGAEMRKTRPCVVISPDEINSTVQTVILAPLTSRRSRFPFRVDCQFLGRDGQVALDQMRSLDRRRFVKRLGRLDAATATRVSKMLIELFKRPHLP